MKADAPRSAEQEALEWAVDFFGRHCAYLHASQKAIEKDFDKGMRLMLTDKVQRGEPLDLLERKFVAGLLRDNTPFGKRRGGRRGPSAGDKHQRDIVIAMGVLRVVKNFGLAATRNKSSGHACAASIVQQALASADIHMTEDAIKKIWLKNEKVTRFVHEVLPIRS
jgi:hypothetical protein